MNKSKTPTDRLRMALGDFGGSADDKHKAYYGLFEQGKAVELEEHPFGLPIWKRPDHPHQSITLIAYPGDSDGSVEAMTIALRRIASLYHWTGRFVPRMRIIRAEYTQDWHSKNYKYIHWVYFEVETPGGSVICGGCNDFSGADSRRETLEDLFSLVSFIMGASVEDVTVQDHNEKIREKMIEDYTLKAKEREMQLAD